MSLKVYDGQGRWRSKTVAFRISPEENEQLETAVRLSGLRYQKNQASSEGRDGKMIEMLCESICSDKG